MPEEAKGEENKSFEFVDSGPPPDGRQRKLIFDSFAKIVGPQIGRQKGQGRRTGQNRGTFIFTWGAGFHGQLGRKFQRGQKKYSAIPLMVETDLVVRQVTCGGLHTALCTEHGDVYTWGNGRKGQLGHLTDISLNSSPRLVEALSSVHVTQIACGFSHTLALTDSGLMYSWGWARFGQIGHGDRQSVKTPKRIDSNEHCRDIVAIAAGNKHSMAINKKGIALSWGCGEHGQTGQQAGRGESELIADGDRLVPTVMEELVNLDKKIASVACGSIHSCLVTTQGELFLCGFFEYFYPNEAQHFFYTPKEVQMPEPVQQIACGQSHNVALSTTGNVYTWGSGEYGQLGCGIKGNVSMPRMVLDGKDIATVGAGRYHSFAVSDAGHLYSWGCGENGQLGLNSDENITLPTVVTHILGTVVGQVSCGEHHSAILTSAPWTKLSQDTAEWLQSSKVEMEMKKAILKKTHRGLTRKDLTKVKEDMKKWQIQHEKKKADSHAEEEMELQRDINSIQYREALTDSVLKDMDEKVKTMKLPQVQSEETDHHDQNDERPSKDSKDTVRLPKVHKKKAQTAKSTARSVESPYRRATSAAQANPSNLGDTQMTAPFTRTAFLKETAQMVRRMKSVVTEKGEATNQKELQRMIRLVFAYRKDYDSLKHISNNFSKELEVLMKEQNLLQKSEQLSKDTFNECYEQLKGLEMQLNTVTIKIAETSENRKNYELNIAHLKEEDFEHFNQLKALRKQCQDNNSFFKKMNELKAQAIEEKERAEAELEEFQKEIQGYQKFVNEQLQQFESILGIVRSQNEKREKARQLRSEKTRAKMASRIEKLNQEAKAADKEGGVLTSKLMSLDYKMRHFEDLFQKITAATGLANPEAIVNKFFFKGEIKDQLELEVEDKQMQIENLKQEEAELQQGLIDAKGGFKNETWRDVNILADENRERDFKASINQTEMAQVRERLSFGQEGLMSLMSQIEEAQGGDHPPMECDDLWTADQAGAVFERISNAVTVMLEVEKERKLKMQEEEKKRLEEEEKSKKTMEEDTYSFMDRSTLKDLRAQQAFEDKDGEATQEMGGEAAVS